MNFLTVEELASMLKVDPSDVMSLIADGNVRAVRIGQKLRIRESELADLETRCPATNCARAVENSGVTRNGDEIRITRTKTGREFRVRGDMAQGFEIWPGKMTTPIRFPGGFLPALLDHFGGQRLAVGGQFDKPGINTLGEFIQSYIRTRMNPAVYVRSLLIEEGYAVEDGRGYVRLVRKPDDAVGHAA